MPTNEIRMTRRVTFSSGHRYWMTANSAEENRAIYGRWASPYNHGHNYVLEVTVAGSVDLRTGMVVNIKRVDDVLKAVVLAEFDQKSINDEIAHFADRSSSVENILSYLAERIAPKLPSECRLVALKLQETELFYGEWIAEPESKMTLTRIYEFAAAHRLHSPALSDNENVAIFGKCNNPAGHGHNYVLEVTIEGEPDPASGMMADIGTVDRTVAEKVVDRYDHKNLNVDLPEFEGRPTSSEIVALEIFDRLKDELPAKLSRIRLYETARNMFEVSAS